MEEMKDLKSRSIKDIISPFWAWKNLFKPPVTIKDPVNRPAAEAYRGFHKNDSGACIGCGTCEEICQNGAIDLVPVEGVKTTRTDSGLRPRIDYGRCCWCALCVDVCTTGSLTMSREYRWIERDPEAYRFTPGVDSKPWDTLPDGYVRQEGNETRALHRVGMEEKIAEERKASFIEIVKGYSWEQARDEAARCVQCGLCIASCPGHMDIPGYIKAVRENDIEEAFRLIYQTNPLPEVCGRVCTHRCEEVCSLGYLGDSVAIRWIKRYIADSVPGEDYQRILGTREVRADRKVAVIGAGPGGLSAAYYLVMAGYDVTVYEDNAQAGGMLRYGIPEYRLPYPSLDKDVAFIESLGVKLMMNTRVGRDIEFTRIYEENDAVYISTGQGLPSRIAIPGEEIPGVISGLKLLADITEGKNPQVGDSVAVIGGGNVAMDAARTSIRLGARVAVYYRRREQDMPADREEIVEGREEGVEFITQAIPLRVETRPGGKLALIWGPADMIPDQGGRPRPVLRGGEENEAVVDTIIGAIGQEADFSFIPEDTAARLGFNRKKIEVDRFGRTGDSKIFAGGDMANPTADAISAIGDGHRAARGIDEFLRGGK